MCVQESKKVFSNNFYIFSFFIIAGIISGLSEISILENLGAIITELFIKAFKCISIPIISLSIIVTLSNQNSSISSKLIWQRVVLYTFTTTIVASTISAIIYLLIKPSNMICIDNNQQITHNYNTNYLNHLANIIPNNIFSPFLEQNVLSVLITSLVIGIAIQNLPSNEGRSNVIGFFNGIYSIFLLITKWIILLIPLALFGFITSSILEIKQGGNFKGIIEYLLVIISANIIQGLILLPLWLRIRGISPYITLKKMMPTLSLAFFTKSSSGIIGVTMNNIEEELNVEPQISRFVIPLCTSINMNGCAAFIFTTVIYVMQNYGIEISFYTIIMWVFISTIAAIGNAGVPMGCFFLSISLLSSMNIPIELLSIILPFYNFIDMVETSLNVWSDTCITKVVDLDVKKNITI